MKESFLKPVAIVVVVVMLSAVSLGGPHDVAVSISTEATSIAIPAAEIWSDNFDDEDISDWQTFAVNGSTIPSYIQEGNTSADGGVMRHDGRLWTYAGHNSSVAYGTWSFDIDIQDPINEFHFSILFMSEIYNDDWRAAETLGKCYCVIFYTNEFKDHDIVLFQSDVGLKLEIDHYIEESIIGWKNIIITRELTGQFYIYMDGSLILKGRNTVYTTSERFYFASKGNPAIDNVTVSDTIDYDAAPPEWTHDITNQQIVLGESFHYDLNATDYSGIDQWWIDDVENFAIDSDGIVTSVGNLVAGDYNISVSVNDTLDNTQTSSFLLTVEASFPMDLILVTVGGSIAVIVLLVVWSKRR
ncbi:MAG: hypothetical protein RTV31_02155 [Candidatus Thorarchaeota archaeon]